ncbi:MAG: hypothetical protein HXY34_08575 [Candidatus Thorarchaeota archaeon]|nr:hypothetical protein [Candidatus Thorarchaeota archaeon]
MQMFGDIDVGALLAAMAFLLVGVVSTWEAERLSRRALGLEIAFPDQPDYDERVQSRMTTFAKLKRKWTVAYVIQLFVVASGGFLLLVSLAGPFFIIGLSGALFFLLCSGLDSMCHRGILFGASPDPLVRLESFLQTVQDRTPVAERSDRLRKSIVAVATDRGLDPNQMRLLLAHLSVRDDLIGEVARELAEQTSPL